MNGEAGGSESAFLSKTQNATTMKSYFGDFKILMQRVKDFGKPALVLLEADAYGFLEQQAWRARTERCICQNVHRHHLVAVAVKQLASVWRPARIRPPAGRNRDAWDTTWVWVRHDIDLKRARILTLVGHPSPVR